jgi:catechol 2,3-dioxygenase-like lactoylglutathione lyase family enzyme
LEQALCKEIGGNMKFVCSLICVKDIAASRKFYQNLFGLRVKFYFGENITFDCGLALQENFSLLAGISENEIKYKTNNFELYFEEDNFDDFMLKLDEYKNIEYIHDVKEYDWGQRVIRFYDMDKHIIEVGESMDTVIKRFLTSGLSIEETAKKSQHPVEYVKKLVE